MSVFLTSAWIAAQNQSTGVESEPVGALGSLSAGTVAGHFALDVVAIGLLIGLAYRRRRSDSEMMFALTVLNLGLFATVVAISGDTVSAGVGFGLFGMLSLIRLRSASFTTTDMAYAFLVLVLGLVCGLLDLPLPLTAVLAGGLVTTVLITDHPRLHRSTRSIELTMDRVYHSPAQVQPDVAARLGLHVLSAVIEEVDFVREVTRVRATVAEGAPTRAVSPAFDLTGPRHS